MDITSIMAKATSAVEFMYDKKAIIKRYMSIVKPNGADGMDWVPVYENVPCRLSNPSLNNAKQGEANVVQYDVKLFLSSDFKVKAGDEITVYSLEKGKIVNSKNYESAKEPFGYVTHQEVLLLRKGYA
ncbi:hypothetical protein [Cytobacillus purgationiresistens]|uniref:Phage protein n=1 Tax=Cytobacillus purgationiresistens TaxID=863449 RepID=A0ABU0AFA1_9BACI|nr:hypothetical protein [Cytobacillus purgationiresistens]MDQ0269942.1 hypothetical protein [Cytobacillus purgationiresistens]